jgi:hypothetical protein
MNFTDILFRCSSLGYIMTDPREKSAKDRGELSETCKTHLVDVYVSNKYGRREDICNKYVEKGLTVEEDSITLHSRVKKQMFFKNERHFANHWIKGTPDLFNKNIAKLNFIEKNGSWHWDGTLHNDLVVTDIKSSWDLYTFMRTITKDVNKMYWWQLQGYMDLTGASSAVLAYCLVDTPPQLIEDEQRRLMYRMGVIDPTGNDEYQKACEELEISMTFGDIPLSEKVLEYEVKRDDEAILKMHKRVEDCRDWLNDFEQTRFPELVKEMVA